jgi:hypothetical protein
VGPYGDRVALGRKEGEAFIEVVAETARYERDLERSVDRATKAAAKGEHFDALTKAMGKAGEDGGNNFERRFINELRRHRPNVVNEIEDVAKISGAGFADLFYGHAFKRNGTGLFSLIGSGFGKLFTSLGSALGDVFQSNIGSGLLSTLGGLASTLALISAIGTPLIATLFGLGNSLAPLVGLLGAIPGLATGALATLAPLVIALQGMGDAISAMTSGDLQKFNDSLKKLSPSAAAFVRELKTLMPIFHEIKRSVQEAFFSQFVGDLSKTLHALQGPLTAGLSNVAFALGSVVSQILKFAGTERFVTFIADLFSSVSDGINKNGPVLVHFLDAMIALADASLPAITVFLDGLAAGADSLSTKLQKSVKDGSFQRFLDNAFKTLKDVLALTGQLLGLLKDMFGTTDKSGKTFLQDITEVIRKLRTFFESDKGKKFIQDMLDTGHDLANILGFIATNMEVINSLFIAGAVAVKGMSDAIDDLGNRSSVLSKFVNIFGGVIPQAMAKPDNSPESAAKKNNFVNTIAAAFGGIIPQLLPHFAAGGFTTGPSLAGESGIEAIIPLDDPARARQIAQDPRIADMIGGTGDMTVIAIFDGEPFQARIVKTVRGKQAATARVLSQKPRLS